MTRYDYRVRNTEEEEGSMGKKDKGNREAKKPKQDKTKK